MSGMSVKSASELFDDYELVLLPDGRQVQRERQTKAQAKIQALIAKSRHEKLRRTLILLSNKTTTSTENRVRQAVTPQNEPVSKNFLSESSFTKAQREQQQNNLSTTTDSSRDDISAIQKQMLSLHEAKLEKPDLSNTETEAKSGKFNPLNIKKLIFG